METLEPIKTEILARHNDGTYALSITWGQRLADLKVYRHSPTMLTIADLTIQDIEKMAYDLMKIVQEERDGRSNPKTLSRGNDSSKHSPKT